MQRIVQIVPRFWPTIDGVGDFAKQLGEEMQQRFALDSHFLVANGAESLESHVSFLKERSALVLVEALESLKPDLVLLHYSGYGYHERGISRWLVDGLEEFCSPTRARFVVFFHEVWASGPPWKSEFYLQCLQKRLVMRLSNLAQTSLTSTPRMQRLLGASRKEVLVVPIPGSIQPVRVVSRSIEGGLKLAVFGQKHGRARSLKAHASLIQHLAARTSLEQLMIIGKDADGAEAGELGSGVMSRTVAFPDADASALTECLSNADAFLSFYPSNLITKSSGAMTAFTFGCPVILPCEAGDDQFVPRPPFMVCDGSAKEILALLEARCQGLWADVARNAVAWSEKHASWDCVVRQIGAAFELSSRSELVEAAV